jgi:hypothetical protein
MKHQEINFTIRELCNEKWRDVAGYEGIYEVSNLGRIRTAYGKTTESVLHGTRIWEQRYLKYKKVSTGYRVTLWKDKACKDHLVARLTCEAWRGAPPDGFTVNHINGNHFDNHAENLEWLSIGDNVRHAFRAGLHLCCKKIALTDIDTGERKCFSSFSDAERAANIRRGTISNKLKKGETVIGKFWLTPF